MTEFFMLTGFPGSGKSTYATKLAEETGAVICSSDALRKELYGSEAVQDYNEEVFQILLKRMIALLHEGKSVIFDAMNISSKYRRNTLKQLKKHAERKISIIIATPYEECLKRNQMRDRHVPEEVIKRAYMNFTVPCLQEGFDEIKVIYSVTGFSTYYKDTPVTYIDLAHDNINHTATIGQHMLNATNYLTANYTQKNVTSFQNADDNNILFLATILHDIGKPFTKTFTDIKGQPTRFAHYFGHNNVGAYRVLFMNIPDKAKLDVSLLIQHHMDYFMSWKQSKKAEQRDREFLGERISNMLDMLHDCDLHAD